MAKNDGTQQTQEFILKHGGLFVSRPGLTTNKKYARRFTATEAATAKERFAAKGTLVEIVLAEDEQ